MAALEHMVPHAYTNKISDKPLTYIQQTVNILTIEHVYRYATLLLGVRVSWGCVYRHSGELECYLCRWVCYRRAVRQGVTSVRRPLDVPHTVLVVYQPTQLPGGTMTPPEGAFTPPTPIHRV